MSNQFIAFFVATLFLFASLGFTWAWNASFAALGMPLPTEFYLVPALIGMTGVLWGSVEQLLEEST